MMAAVGLVAWGVHGSIWWCERGVDDKAAELESAVAGIFEAAAEPLVSTACREGGPNRFGVGISYPLDRGLTRVEVRETLRDEGWDVDEGGAVSPDGDYRLMYPWTSRRVDGLGRHVELLVSFND